MILVYIKLAIRLLMRRPFLSIVNVFGLSSGFAAFFALWQYSSAELKTDQHHQDVHRIVRIGMHQRWSEPGNSGNLTFGASKASLPPRFKSDFPEVESFVRICEQGGFFQEDLIDTHGSRLVISHTRANGEQRILKETKAAYADRNFFEFFTIPMIHGDASSALAGVNFVALSRSMSEKYFDDANPVGEMLQLNDSITLKVTAVFEDFPHNSKLFYDMVISNEGLLKKWSEVYWGGTQNFIKLRKGASYKDFEDKLNGQKTRYWGNELAECRCDRILFAQPMTEIMFGNRFIGDEGQYKSKGMLLTLKLVAAIVLLMAWINYVNLSVASMASRLKEFGARRVNGATALDLAVQFMTEAMLVNVLAAGLALTILQLVRTPLENILEIYISGFWSTTLEVWLTLAATIFCGVLLTGGYPAYVCIARQPRLLLTARYSNRKSATKSFLTTLQFTAALALIVWVFIVYLQLNHVLKKDIGLDQDGVVIVEGPVVKPPNFERVLDSFLAQLADRPGVVQATSSRYMVGDEIGKPGAVRIVGSDVETGADANGVRENFVPFFRMNLLAGRNFVATDRDNVVILSEVTTRRLGFKNPADAIGTKVELNTGNWRIHKVGEVIGVVEDYQSTPFFNYSGANTIVSEGGFGSFFTFKDSMFPELTPENVAIKVDVSHAKSVMKEVEELYQFLFPGNTFEWRFLDDQIASIYGSEKLVRNQILMFTVLAIAIACMGLVAMTTQRIIDMTREIGIRKVLGASIGDLIFVLARSTMAQFLIAASLAVPLSYFLGREYLQRYSERITLSWWHYGLPMIIMLVIVCGAIGHILRKALRSNPVDSLKQN